MVVDAVQLEGRLSTIEAKLDDNAVRERVTSTEKELKELVGSVTRFEEHRRHLPSEKDFRDLLQRVVQLEVRVAHLPSKGFIISVVTAAGSLLAVGMSFGKIRTLLGF